MAAVIGLTGGIGCGKSVFGRFLVEAGATVIDADQLARNVVAQGTDGYEAVVTRFGPSVVAPTGDLDRAALAAIVFDDAAARADLNAIVHPRVRAASAAAIGAALERGAPAIFYEAALLFETGTDAIFAATVVVGCSPAEQRARVARRDGLDDAAIDARIASQMPLEAKRERATRYVGNDGTLEELRTAAAETFRWACALGA